MLRTAALLSFALLTACVSLTETTAGAAQELRLATWNLEHLAAQNGAGCRPRSDKDYADLRSHAEQLKADVVALQEVESEAAAARVFTSDRWTVVMSDRPDAVREGFCRGTSGPQILKQDVGFAIRKGVPFKRNPDLRELGLGNPDLRWGVDVTVQTKSPIRLLSVHLKSGCNAGNDPNDRDCPIIFAQAPVLEKWIDDRARAGEDFAILGDWNRRTARPGDAFLTLVSDDDPPGGRIVMADAGLRARCIQRYSDFIDHVGLGERTARRLVAGTFKEYLYGVSEELYPSDHCPQLVTLRSR